MLDALNSVLPAVGTKKLSAYFVIRNRTVTAFNGEQVLTAPIACDLQFAPKAKAFARAIKKCKKATVAFWIHPKTGQVMIHANNETHTVDCAQLDLFPHPLPQGNWFNVPKPRKPPVPKCVPPEPVWLAPDYLPGLEEAKAFKVSLFTTAELVAACNACEAMMCDCEVFENYFLVAFTSRVSGKVVYFEIKDDERFEPEQFDRLRWILERFLIVTFSGNGFDLPILALALAGWGCKQLKAAAERIIAEQVKPWMVLKAAKVKRLKIDHIDLEEVLPGVFTSLKQYGGRLHAPRLQDLPFPHNAVLSPDQITIVRWYCVNDLCCTAFCYVGLREQLEIRSSMGERYGMDLRSKSDAQIAEAVINGELQRLTFNEPSRPEIAPGTRYKYRTPSFVKFQTPRLNGILNTIQGWEFYVTEAGSIEIPVDPETGKSFALSVQIADATYTIGIGGLHSNETVVSHVANADTLILDRDVTSYYPSIILNLELYPLHLGPAFLQVYRSIVQRRIEAKKAKNKVEAELLKIVVNGSFGKLGSKWSTLYAPDLMMTVTITGQLCLLMLIEALELRGITICSANTDGLVIKCPKELRAVLNNEFDRWELATGFKTEETEYRGIYCRDVNNYIAVKTDGKTKTKGAYFNPWALANPGDKYDRFKKNPTGTIIVEAVTRYLVEGVPVSETIRGCTDIKKFVSIRTVKGGAVKDGVYLGKVVRWYVSTEEAGYIVYASSGKKVAETDNARPCMRLPATLPADVDFAYYENEAVKALEEIAAIPKKETI